MSISYRLDHGCCQFEWGFSHYMIWTIRYEPYDMHNMIWTIWYGPYNTHVCIDHMIWLLYDIGYIVAALWCKLITVFRNFKDELPLDSFSPLICFDHEELIAVEFNLTGPATIDTRSQYSDIGFTKKLDVWIIVLWTI